MPKNIRVIQYGLGPIGRAVGAHIVERAGLVLVGAVDIDPSLIGHDAGRVLGLEDDLGFPVVATLAEALQRSAAHVAVHTTSSYFDTFEDQIRELLAAGLDVVSTSEELVYPWLAHPESATILDAVARQAKRTVLGTGVNPGFLMDALPLSLTAICQQVEWLEVKRVINASTRRGPFQAKIGAGMSEEAFREKLAAGRMGHVGLPESMAMLFDTLGKRLTGYEDKVEPLLAEVPVRTTFFDVPAGRLRGLKQVARGYCAGRLFATLTFVAGLDEPDEADTIRIHGRPNLEVRLQGTNGDIATAAIAVNAIRAARAAGPGLTTMRDVGMVTWW